MNRFDLHAHAERLGIPLRTKAQVQETIRKAVKNNSDSSCACLLLTHGRLEDDAREWLKANYPNA